MFWMLLLQSEYRRVKKAVVTLGSTQPLVLAAIAALAVSTIALSVRMCEALFIISFIPGGLTGFTIFVLLVGGVSGFSFSLMLPRETHFDEQFRSLPVRKIEVLLGLRALPLVFMSGLAGIPTLAMLWRLYARIDVPATGFWLGIFTILFMAVSIQGASVSEAVRGYRSWGLFSVGTLAIAGTLVVSLLLSAIADGPWLWLASSLPQASLHLGEFSVTQPPIHVAVIGAGVSMLLSTLAWIAYSLRPDPPPRQRRLRLAVPIGKGIFAACLSWVVLNALRQPYSRSFFALAITIGLGAVALLSIWSVGETDSLMVPLAFFLALYVTALAVLTLSEDREAASWLVNTVPMPARSIALTWWIPASLLVLIIGSASSLPVAVGFGDISAVWTLSVLLAAYVCCTPIIGQVLPWDRRSPSRQFFANVGVTVGAGAAFYAVDRLGMLTEIVFGPNLLSAPVGGILLLTGAGALSITIEWAKS